MFINPGYRETFILKMYVCMEYDGTVKVFIVKKHFNLKRLHLRETDANKPFAIVITFQACSLNRHHNDYTARALFAFNDGYYKTILLTS